MLGSLLVAWQYHIEAAPELIGLHFLALDAGYVIGSGIAQRILRRVFRFAQLRYVACAVAAASLLGLSFVVPPVLPIWRIIGLAFVGLSGGGLVTALLYGAESYYHKAPAAAASLSGVLFGCGCLLATLLIAIDVFRRFGSD